MSADELKSGVAAPGTPADAIHVFLQPGNYSLHALPLHAVHVFKAQKPNSWWGDGTAAAAAPGLRGATLVDPHYETEMQNRRNLIVAT